jgi:nucleotide-binding universal stress UspA family protein
MKILVTTDFSPNSKAAIQVAATMAKQATGVELIFYSAVEMMQPQAWNLSFLQKICDGRKTQINQRVREICFGSYWNQ